MSSARALMGAVRAQLLADAAVTALLGAPARVYDDPPQDPVFPYVTLGRIETRPIDSAGVAASEHVVTLHVWSRYGGRAEALDVVAAMRACVHDADITAPGVAIISLFATFTDVFRSGDGRTTHGVLRLRAVSEP